MARNPSISKIAVASNMVQGVSQQAPQNRRDAQCEEQFDCINSVLDGVVPRPHGEYVKLLGGGGMDFTGGYFSETSHGSDENYVICFKADGTPYAYNLDDGTACAMTRTSGAGYLSSGYVAGVNIAKEFVRTQVADDYTFVANRNVAPAMAATLSPAKVNEALIFVRATTFNTAYTAVLSGSGVGTVTATYTTNATTVTSTETIAESLRASIEAAAGWTAIRSGSIIRARRDDGNPFDVATSDGNGDDYLRAFNGECASISRLPQRAFDGMILKVRGSSQTGADDYYVRFVGNSATGSWQEVIAPGTKTSLNASTMPVGVINIGLNAFEVKELSWSTRIAGDADSSREPSFVGKKLRGLMYHQRRLGVIWSGGTVFSKTDNPFTYFADSVQTVLATAPVDTKVAGSNGKGPPTLDFGLEFQENLFIWAQQQQFRIDSGQDPFKQDTVEVRNSMAYEYSPAAYPLSVGAFLYLSTDIGNAAALRVLQFSGGKLAGDTDVSAHVPKYVPAGVQVLTGSDSLRHLYMVSDDDRSVITQFCWTYSANEGFIQTAFNKWRIPGGQVLWASLKSNMLRVLQQRPEGAVLITFNLSPQITDPEAGSTYVTRMDFRVNETLVTDRVNGTLQSSFKLPYKPTGADVLVATRDDKVGGFTRGREFPVTSVVDDVVTVDGDLTGYHFYVGQRITAERTDSRFYIRTENGAEPVDDITLNRYKVELSETQYTRIEVTRGDEVWTEVFEGRVLGTDGGHTGIPDPVDYSMDIGIEGKSSEVSVRLINDTFMASKWQNSSYDFDAVGWKGSK